MAYRLAQDESILRGLRRIVREDVESAVDQLRTKDASKRDEGIHEARKSIKKLRGVVRLIMPELGDAAEEDNTRLRDIGRTLSEFRDAAALVEMVDTLSEKYKEEPGAKSLKSVRAELMRRRDAAAKQQDAEGLAEEAITGLRSFRRRANSWRLDTDGFEAIAPGFKLTYRRGRKALARARKNPTAVNYHDLRKRVKDHWYHVRLLESLWTDSMEAREKSLKDLQEWLGDDHNLVILRERIAAEPNPFGDAEAISQVNDLIDKVQKELRDNSLTEGERIYSEKPNALVRRLERLWIAWHEQPKKAISAA